MNDMGDTWTEALPYNWLQDYIPALEALPHYLLFLTKRPNEMFTFFVDCVGYVPNNFILGVSVTTRANKNRIANLHSLDMHMQTEGHEPVKTAVSFEPVLENGYLPEPLMIDWKENETPIKTTIDWLFLGGQSRQRGKAHSVNLDHFRAVVEHCRSVGTAVFVKQLGTAWARKNGCDFKGENWNTWPEDLRVREVPAFPPIIRPGTQFSLL